MKPGARGARPNEGRLFFSFFFVLFLWGQTYFSNSFPSSTMNKTTNRLTVAQAALALGMSERTLRRRVADGKIAAVKDSTPTTGTAWFIEAATVDALLCPSSQSAPTEEEQKEEETAPVAPLALLERSAQAVEPQPEAHAEIVQLRGEVLQIKAFLLGQVTAEDGQRLPVNLGTVIGQAISETLAPMMERIERQSAENALLKQQLAQALEQTAQVEARQKEHETATKPRFRTLHRAAWWPFSKRHK